MIRRLFTDIAGIYDRMNLLLSLGLDHVWRRKALRLIPPCHPRHIIDLATGTGEMAFRLSDRFLEANVIGIDLTPAMLNIARSKNTSTRVTFAEADARAFRAPLACRDASVDLVTCAFGFRNFPDRAAALHECARTLRPGGLMLVLEFFRPRNSVLRALIDLWIRTLARFFAPGCQSAYTHLRKSMRETCQEDEFIREAEAHGLRPNGRRFFPPACTALLFKRETDLRAKH